MQRLDATGVVVKLAGESPIVGGVGNSTFDLIPFDRPANFYMWNSMGMGGVNAVAQTHGGIEKRLRYRIYGSKPQA